MLSTTQIENYLKRIDFKDKISVSYNCLKEIQNLHQIIEAYVFDLENSSLFPMIEEFSIFFRNFE